jgi:hypothetical protein
MMNLFVTKFLPHHLPCGLPRYHIYDEHFCHKDLPHQMPYQLLCYFAMSSASWKSTTVRIVTFLDTLMTNYNVTDLVTFVVCVIKSMTIFLSS